MIADKLHPINLDNEKEKSNFTLENKMRQEKSVTELNATHKNSINCIIMHFMVIFSFLFLSGGFNEKNHNENNCKKVEFQDYYEILCTKALKNNADRINGIVSCA